MAIYNHMEGVWQAEHFLQYGNIMIDLETLGRSADAQIISFAAVEFNKYTGAVGSNLEFWVDPADWGKNGRELDGETIMWWLGQSDEARSGLKCPSNHYYDHGSLSTGLERLSEFYRHHTNPFAFGDHKGDKCVVWGNGSTFDISILTSSYKAFGMDTPWEFYSVNDVRTVVDFMPEVKKETKFEGEKHTPLADCLHQVKYLSETIKCLGIPARELVLREGTENEKLLYPYGRPKKNILADPIVVL